MPTHLVIDVRLLNQALKNGGYHTRRETVNQALFEFIQRRKQAEVASLFGKIDYDPEYDYKAARYRA